MTTERKWIGENIPEKEWGRDHDSTLLYLETRVVDHRGKLDMRHMRKDGNKHPTRLAEGVSLVGHTDLNCVDDFEAAGLLTNVGTGISPVIVMKDKGWECAHNLRRKRGTRE